MECLFFSSLQVVSFPFNVGLGRGKVHSMSSRRAIVTFVTGCLLLPSLLAGQDVVARVKRYAELYTLDQPGTHAFHLKAELAPSFDRDKASGRTGEIEIWWASPTRWRREVRCASFYQIEIVDGSRDWQKNEGAVFPEWLREMAVAVVQPIPDLDATLAHVKTAAVRNEGRGINISWDEPGTDGSVSKGNGAVIELDNDGPLFAMSLGAVASLHEVVDFHGRQVARKVSGEFGGPEVTARVTILEDLKEMPADPGGLSDAILKTVVMKELEVRRNLQPEQFGGWPPLPIGPIEGVMLLEALIDRTGKVVDFGSYLSDNPGLRAAAEDRARAMRFEPLVRDGMPVQVLTTITLPFKTTRPPGVELFPPSKQIPAAAGVSPYVLKAEFTTRGSGGEVIKGTYTDTWLSDTQWRREAEFGKSRLVRSRNGGKTYLLSEGPDAGLLRILLKTLEPIPDTTSWFELEWLVVHDSVDGVPALRVSRGPVNPEGVLEPQTQGYWFDESGTLIKTHEQGLDTRLTNRGDFAGLQVARRIEMFNHDKLALRLDITDLSAAGTVDPAIFTLKGHEWVHQFTPEVR